MSEQYIILIFGVFVSIYMLMDIKCAKGFRSFFISLIPMSCAMLLSFNINDVNLYIVPYITPYLNKIGVEGNIEGLCRIFEMFIMLPLTEVTVYGTCYTLAIASISALFYFISISMLQYIGPIGVVPIFGVIFTIVIITGQVAHIRKNKMQQINK